MKFFILFALAFCVLADNANEEKVPEKDKSAVQKIMEATLEKIQILFDSGIGKAQDSIAKIFDIIGGVRDSINSNIESAKKSIQDLAGKGEKYMKCAKEQEAALQEIEKNTKADIAECKRNADDKSKGVVEDLKLQAANIQKEVGEAVGKCFEEHPFTSLLCASKEMVKTYAKASISIMKSVAASREVIGQIRTETQKCVTNAQEKSKSEYNKVLAEIQACADAA